MPPPTQHSSNITTQSTGMKRQHSITSGSTAGSEIADTPKGINDEDQHHLKIERSTRKKPCLQDEIDSFLKPIENIFSIATSKTMQSILKNSNHL